MSSSYPVCGDTCFSQVQSNRPHFLEATRLWGSPGTSRSSSRQPSWGKTNNRHQPPHVSDDTSKGFRLLLSNHTQLLSSQPRPHTTWSRAANVPCLNFWPTDCVDKINGCFKPHRCDTTCYVAVVTEDPSTFTWRVQHPLTVLAAITYFVNYCKTVIFLIVTSSSFISWYYSIKKLAFLQSLMPFDYPAVQTLQKDVTCA